MRWFESIVNAVVDLISSFATKEIAFAFAFAILLIGLAVWAGLVLRPHLAFMGAIRNATRSVRAIIGGSKDTSDDRLALIDKQLKTNAVLREAWRSYRLSLRPDPK